jgi:hypothetical protein
MAKADLGAWAVLVRYASSPIWYVAGHQVTRRSATARNLCFVYHLESECDYCGLTMHKFTNARALKHGIGSLGFMHHQGRTHICLELRVALLRPRFLSGVA